MFGFWKKKNGQDLILALHNAVVDASRRPVLYAQCRLPDTVEGRFEALTLHGLVVLRRLRQLPPPADDVAQEFMDAIFAHLEIALREMGIGDFGVPKRMKKLAEAFFDRTSKYDPLISRGDVDGLAAAIGERLALDGAGLRHFASLILASEAKLAGADLDAILAGPPFATPAEAASRTDLESIR